jgi:hypothetical protein
MLDVDEVMEMLVLLCEFLDVLANEMDPGAIDDIVRIPVARNAFVHKPSILQHHLVLHVHELVILACILFERCQEPFLI